MFCLMDVLVVNTILGTFSHINSVMMDSEADKMATRTVFGSSFKVTHERTYQDRYPTTHTQGHKSTVFAADITTGGTYMRTKRLGARDQ